MVRRDTMVERETGSLITLGEASRLLRVNRKTLRRWTDCGILRTYRFGPRGDRRFAREDLAKMLRSGHRSP